MPKVIDAKNWQLVPASDGRRYSKYPDGVIDSFDVSAYTTGGSSEIAYQIYDPDTLTWGSWIGGVDGGVGGTTTTVSGTPLAGPFAFTNQTDVALDTLIESNAVTISSDGHQVKLRRRSSSSYEAVRTAYAVINSVESSPWTVTTEAQGTPTNPDPRVDVLATIKQDRGADEYNPTRATWVKPDAEDSAELWYLMDNRWSPPSSYNDWPQLEVKAGDHVVEGDRGVYVTLYGPDHVSGIEYGYQDNWADGYGRARVAMTFQNFLRGSVWTLPRYSSSLGYRETFWLAHSLYFPEDFIFDRSNLSMIGIAAGTSSSGPPTCFEFGQPTQSSPRWRWTIENYSTSSVQPTGIAARKEILPNGTDMPTEAQMRGKRMHFVYRFRMDNRTVAEGGNPLFKAWVNMDGENPREIIDWDGIPWGPNPANDILGGWSVGYAMYKPGWHKGVIEGTYGGYLDPAQSISLGMGYFRLHGDTATFADVHPLKQGLT